MIWIKIAVIRRAITSSHPFSFTLTETVLHSLLNLVAVGLRVPSPVPNPVPSLPQNEPAALHSRIEALLTAQPDEWTEEVRKSFSERGIAWMRIARDNVHIARELKQPELATTAQDRKSTRLNSSHAS